MGHLLTVQIQDTCGGSHVFSSVRTDVVQDLVNLKAYLHKTLRTCLHRMPTGSSFILALKAFCRK